MASFSTQEVLDAVNEMAPQYGIPPAHARAILLAENTKDGVARPTMSGDATNSKETMGVGQVIPTTARGLQQQGMLPADWTFDPNNLKTQLQASLAAMADMRNRLKNPNDPYELGAYYNGGTNGLRTYQAGGQLVPETDQYIKKMRTAMGDQMTPQQIEQAASNPGPGATGKQTVQGSSSRTSTTTNIYDPVAQANFNDANNAFLASLQQGIATTQDRTGQVAQGAMDLMGSIIQAGKSAGAAATAEATTAATEAARRQVILQRANMDPASTNSRMDQALQAIDTTSVALDTLGADINSRQSVGFFDNPIVWAANQTRLPGMVGEYNGLVRVQQNAIGKYQAVAGITENAIDASKSMDADQILAQGAAKAQAEQDKSVALAKQVNYQLQGKAAADALQVVNMNLYRLNAAQKALMDSKQRTVESQGETEREIAEKAQAAALSDFNMLVTAAGGQGIPLDRFKQLDGKTKNEVLTRNSTSQFGSNLYDATQFVNKYGNFNNMARGGQLAVTQWVTQAAQKADEDTKAKWELSQSPQAAANPALKNFDPKTYAPEALKSIGTTMSMEADSNLRAGSGTSYNPYKIPYEQVLKNPALANNSWAKDMAAFGPGGAKQLYQNWDEENFMRRKVTEILAAPDPTAAIKQAAGDIASFYQQASKITQATTKPQMFGLDTPQRTYAVILPTTNVGAKPTTVDMGNPAHMERALTAKVVAQLRSTQYTPWGSDIEQFGSSFGSATPEQQKFLDNQQKPGAR